MTPTTRADVRESSADMSSRPRAMVEPTSTSRARTEAAQCSLAVRNPAMRTEPIFGPIQVRVFDDVTSPLNRTAASPYDQRERRPPTAAEIDALERQKGRPLTDAEMYDLGHQPNRPLTEANAPIAREPSALSRGDVQAGETGGKQQETGSAQQAGTSEEIGRSRPTSSEHQLTLTERDRLSPEQRARLYGDDARIADRRGNLIWSGWLKPNETVAIPNANGPIRYDYRFQVDDRFHDERTAWCHNNVITVP